MRDLARHRHLRRSHGLAPSCAGALRDEAERMVEAVRLKAVRGARNVSPA